MSAAIVFSPDAHADVQYPGGKIRHLGTANYEFLKPLCRWKTELDRELLPADMSLPLCKSCVKLEDYIPTENALAEYHKCTDCGVDVRSLGESSYFIRPSVWATAYPDSGDDVEARPCIGCLEARLKRTLRANDFGNFAGKPLAEVIEDTPLNYGARIKERANASKSVALD